MSSIGSVIARSLEIPECAIPFFEAYAESLLNSGRGEVVKQKISVTVEYLGEFIQRMENLRDTLISHVESNVDTLVRLHIEIANHNETLNRSEGVAEDITKETLPKTISFAGNNEEELVRLVLGVSSGHIQRLQALVEKLSNA